VQRFTDIPNIQRNVTLLQGIPENDFHDCFWQWHHHLMKRIPSQREYFKTEAASAQVNKFCFHIAIPGIKVLHLIHHPTTKTGSLNTVLF
jgi:hypothetical protein